MGSDLKGAIERTRVLWTLEPGKKTIKEGKRGSHFCESILDRTELLIRKVWDEHNRATTDVVPLVGWGGGREGESKERGDVVARFFRKKEGQDRE